MGWLQSALDLPPHIFFNARNVMECIEREQFAVVALFLLTEPQQLHRPSNGEHTATAVRITVDGYSIDFHSVINACRE